MYAVGLTLYEIATLDYALPLPAEQHSERWKDTHLYGRVKRLTEARSDLPDAVEQILLKLAAKRPQDRFGSWKEVRSALDAAWKSTAAAGQTHAHAERIIRAVTDARAMRQEAESAAAEEVQRRSEIAGAASYQWAQLLDESERSLSHLVNVGTVVVERRHGNLVVTIDGTLIAQAGLLNIGEHKFRNGSITNTIATLTTACRTGLNAILRRDNDDDMYGRWEGVGWGRNALFFLGQTVEHRPEPFAIEGDELERGLRNLDGVTTDVQASRISDIAPRFVALLAECVEKVKGRL